MSARPFPLFGSGTASTALVVFLTALMAQPAPAADGEWLEFPPPVRIGHTGIYDPVRDRMVIFGGSEGGMYHDDVWGLSLSGDARWTKLDPSGTPPSVRKGHSAVYDPVRDRMLVFGGRSPGGPGEPHNDVWALSLSDSPTWTLIVPEGSPPSARDGHSAIYDPLSDRMLIFGATQEGEVWELSLAGFPAWSRLIAAGTPPPPRFGHSAIYDPVRQRMVIFGGAFRNDMWALALGGSPKWFEIVPPGAQPVARAHHIAVYDAARDRMIVIGGYDSFEKSVTGQCRALPLSGNAPWQQLPARHAAEHAGIYDPLRDGVAVYGGTDFNGVSSNITWRLPLAAPSSWSVYSPADWPWNRSGSTAAYDPAPGRMVMFGGLGVGGVDPFPLDNTWSFSLTGEPAWTQVSSNGPSARHGHTAVYDATRDRMVVFGGDEFYGDHRNDTWALSLATSLEWSPIEPSGAPPAPRQGHSAIYDPVRDRMLVFGGTVIVSSPASTSSMPYGDVWELSFSGSPHWTMLEPLGVPPSARQGHTAIYDPVRDRMLVFGGVDAWEGLNDLWALSLAGIPEWTLLTPAGEAPSPRGGHTGIYDPWRVRMVVFGGTAARDVWTLDLAASPLWSPFESSGIPPSGAWDHSAIFDVAADRMVVFGGPYGSAALTALTFNEPTSVAAEAPPAVRFALHGARPNPAFEKLTVSFALASSEPAKLDLIDVAGRRVAAREVGSLGPGRHLVNLAGSRLPAGVYFVRLTQRGQSLTSKVSVVR